MQVCSDYNIREGEDALLAVSTWQLAWFLDPQAADFS
jgi:hypothetical protein